MRIYSARNFLKQSARNVGFTLIELLVVIGILGILAAALIATIDPFEQLKKANDANVENAMIEFINANIRYYTINSAFPWDTAADGGNDCVGTLTNGQAFTETGDGSIGLTSVQLNDAGFTDCIQALIDSGELKSAFSTVGYLDEIYVNETNNAMNLCYDPQSKSKTENNQTIYDTDGSTRTDCVGDGGGTNENCLRCTQG